MTDQPANNLFNLSIDDQSNLHLKEAAKWARFLGIVGFVICGIIVLVALFAGAFLGSMMSTLSGGGMSEMGSGFGAIITIVYLLFAALYFFPSLWLYQFGTKMKAALGANDQNDLNMSFSKLKAFFRFWAILTIIILCLYALIFIFAVIGASMLR